MRWRVRQSDTLCSPPSSILILGISYNWNNVIRGLCVFLLSLTMMLSRSFQTRETLSITDEHGKWHGTGAVEDNLKIPQRDKHRITVWPQKHSYFTMCFSWEHSLTNFLWTSVLNMLLGNAKQTPTPMHPLNYAKKKKNHIANCQKLSTKGVAKAFQLCSSYGCKNSKNNRHFVDQWV